MSAAEFPRVKLVPKGRDSARTVSEAVTLLRREAGLRKGDRAKIGVGLLRLPSGDLVGLAEIVFASTRRSTTYAVPLQSAASFNAIRAGYPGYDRYDIARLGSAEVDVNGLVVLSDGTVLEAVKFLSAPMLTKPSETDWRIIHLVLSVIKGGEQCYRSLSEGLPPEVAELVSDERFLDCNRLSALDLPPLKVIAFDIRKKDPTLKASDQKIADALRKVGARQPRRAELKQQDNIPLG